MAREEGFFDELARGLADGSLTRGKALRLMGAALVGGTLASLGIGEAGADAPGCKRAGKHCTRTDQCCGSLVCVSGTCQSPTTTTTETPTTTTTETPTTSTSTSTTSTTPGCRPNNSSCSSDADCCSGFCAEDSICRSTGTLFTCNCVDNQTLQTCINLAPCDEQQLDAVCLSLCAQNGGWTGSGSCASPACDV
jgi:hypothetical protein